MSALTRTTETFTTQDFSPRLSQRRRAGRIWAVVLQAATVVAMLALIALLVNIIDGAFGYAAVEYTVPPETLSSVPLEDLSQDQLITILREHLSTGLLRRYEAEKPLSERSAEDLYGLVVERVVAPKVVAQWSLLDSVFKREEVLRTAAEQYPDAELRMVSWLTTRFLTAPQSGDPMRAGVRTAILGSLWTVAIALLTAFPIGVGAAIYLEEYARDNAVNRVIQVNINNLAGVPSIIYGMLGLAVFVRMLGRFTSGVAFGLAEPSAANGRTILSAGLTLGLLVLPVIIINAQEAIRAVPGSLREASLGLGATRWQTVWHHVLPSALPGILTGTILAISRVMGETAPLVVIGASTFITVDPSGPFSQFTTLPIQIYQWTSRPQDVFRNLAAAASLVLLGMLLSLNAVAILLRNRYRGK
ncbi:MAG: phosphate ABC transporter permease PstA [Anaerolineales bacterium]